MRLMTPSPVMKKMNDKKFFLPSDYENKYSVDLRSGQRAKSNLNTAQRVFTEYVLTNYNTNNTCNTNNNTTENENKTTSYSKKPANFFFYRPNDSIGNVIGYKFAPEYREEVILITN